MCYSLGYDAGNVLIGTMRWCLIDPDRKLQEIGIRTETQLASIRQIHHSHNKPQHNLTVSKMLQSSICTL